jgi:hypothetical protein
VTDNDIHSLAPLERSSFKGEAPSHALKYKTRWEVTDNDIHSLEPTRVELLQRLLALLANVFYARAEDQTRNLFVFH